jgi:hypothetical protein
MSKATRGVRDRRQPGVMELLARARPASLDPPEAPAPAGEIAARLVATEGGPAANTAGPPRTVQPGTQPTRPGGRTARPATRAAGPARRVRRTVVAGTGVTVTAAAAAVAVLVATAGGGVPSPGRHTPQPVLLTAATLRQVAAASRSALATSGRAVVTYSTTQGGVPQGGGTDDITFSGKNWNDALTETFPGPGGQRGHTQFAINRIVNGQLYLYISARTRRLQWYHDTNPSGHPSFTIPDPRTMLRALEPSARFVAPGYQVIGGMRLKELRATDLSHVAGLGMVAGLAPLGRVTSLEVWVDGHGVVRRMALTSVQTSLVYPARADSARRKADGTIILTLPNKAMAANMRAKLKKATGAAGRPRVIIRIAHPGFGPPHRQSQVTAVTVSFSGIGRPQRIVAPAHAIQQYGRG